MRSVACPSRQLSHRTNRHYEQTACRLFVSTIFPLTSLSYMLLCWQRAELDDATLTDSDQEEEHDGDSSPVVRYATDEEYQQ